VAYRCARRRPPLPSGRVPDPWTPITPRLPVTYADALALSAAGFDSTTIATRLDVPVESIATLLHIATAKLRSLHDADGAKVRQPVTSDATPHTNTTRPTTA
jgi:hypothetical protein